MGHNWPRPSPELYQINVHRSNIKARKTLEQRLLSPLGSNLMTEVTSEVVWRSHNLRGHQKIYYKQHGSMHMELRAIRVTKYNLEIRSDL